MMVEKVPDSTYEMVGGLDKQIKEIKEVCLICNRSNYLNILFCLVDLDQNFSIQSEG